MKNLLLNALGYTRFYYKEDFFFFLSDILFQDTVSSK